MPLVHTPFEKVAIDLIGPLSPPTSKGNRWILTLVDFATRYPEAVALAKTDTESIAEALLGIFSRVGLPTEILSDNGPQFVSSVMKEVARLASMRQIHSSPYHPQANGLCEKFNGTLKKKLRRMSSEKPSDGDRYLEPLLFAHLEAPQESTHFSLFELFYGRSVRGPMAILKELWSKEGTGTEVTHTYQYVGSMAAFLDPGNCSELELYDLPGHDGETFKEVHLNDELTLPRANNLRALMEENETIFIDAPGITELVEHEIKLTTSQPIRVKPYPIPFSQARVVEDEVRKMLASGVVEPSNSP